MNHDGRALTQAATERIQQNIYQGLYDDHEIQRLFETISVQRQVLAELFALWHSEPLKLISTADPIRNATLTHMRERVSMEEP